MFGKKAKPVTVTGNQVPNSSSKPRYQKPAFLLIDCPEEMSTELVNRGFNVQTGTFGSPCRVEKSDEWTWVTVNCHLPGLPEADIVVVDLSLPKMVDGPGEKLTSMQEDDWWCKSSTGIVDTRPRAMAAALEFCERILEHGGWFIVFSEHREFQQIRIGPRAMIRSARDVPHSNWNFIKAFDSCGIKFDYGGSINLSHGIESSLYSPLKRYLDEASYTCTFKPQLDGWEPLLEGKFGSIVGWVGQQRNWKGYVLTLPQFKRKTELVTDLVTLVLPEITPDLFPDTGTGKWVEREPYELPSVSLLKKEKDVACRAYSEQSAALDAKILGERSNYSYIHGVLTKTGRDLVVDTSHLLEHLGFRAVVDIDEIEAYSEEKLEEKQEDLQVRDRPTTLVVEVKGISGLPTEDDCGQVTKYVLRRKNEGSVGDARGVFIVNHQRHMPSLERDNEHVFTVAQIRDAELIRTTLITTWELYLLARGMAEWKWPQSSVQDVLYVSRKTPVVPSHYFPLGTVKRVWSEVLVASIQVDSGSLHRGDRIGFVSPEGFWEEDAESLEIDRQQVSEAKSGSTVGVRVTSLDHVPKGATVYLIRPGSEPAQ